MEATDLAGSEKGRASEMLKELEEWQSSVHDSWEGKDYTN
jgi:hypothetical protein